MTEIPPEDFVSHKVVLHGKIHIDCTLLKDGRVFVQAYDAFPRIEYYSDNIKAYGYLMCDLLDNPKKMTQSSRQARKVFIEEFKLEKLINEDYNDGDYSCITSSGLIYVKQ